MGSDSEDSDPPQYTQTEGTQTQFEPQSNDDDELYTVKCIVAEGIIKGKKMYKASIPFFSTAKRANIYCGHRSSGMVRTQRGNPGKTTGSPGVISLTMS